MTDSGITPPVSPRVRWAFGLLERLAPTIGSRWAVELWCTPPAVDMSLRMPPGVAAGEPVEAFWDGHRIAGEAWGDGPPVYLVHGWGGCRAHLAVFVKPLVAKGYRVIAFDLPGHNESDSGALAAGRTTVIECAEALRAVVREHGPARAVVAHSLGAKAAALAMNKPKANSIMKAAGVPVSESVLVHRLEAAKAHVIEPPYVRQGACRTRAGAGGNTRPAALDNLERNW